MQLHLIYLLLLSLFLSLASCTNKNDTVKDLVAEKLFVDLCVINAPDAIKHYFSLTRGNDDSLKFYFLDAKSSKINELVLPEPNNPFSSSKYLNGFYADYLSWKENYWSPNPENAITIAYWQNQLLRKRKLNDIKVIEDRNFHIVQNTSRSAKFIQLVDSSKNMVTQEIHPTVIIEFKSRDELRIDRKKRTLFNVLEQNDLIGFTTSFSLENDSSLLTFEDLKETVHLNSLQIPINESTSSDINSAELMLLIADRAFRLAELSLKTSTRFESIKTLDFQQYLTEQKAWLFPIINVHPEETGFAATQRLIAAKIIIPDFTEKTFGENNITGNELDRLLYAVSINHRSQFRNRKSVRVVDFINAVWKLQGYPVTDTLQPFRNVRIHKDEATSLAYYHSLLSGKHPWFNEPTFNRNDIVSLSEAALFVDVIFQPLKRFNDLYEN